MKNLWAFKIRYSWNSPIHLKYSEWIVDDWKSLEIHWFQFFHQLFFLVLPVKATPPLAIEKGLNFFHFRGLLKKIVSLKKSCLRFALHFRFFLPVKYICKNPQWGRLDPIKIIPISIIGNVASNLSSFRPPFQQYSSISGMIMPNPTLLGWCSSKLLS